MASNGVPVHSDGEAKWISRVQLFAALLVIFAGVVVWAFTALGGKANAADLFSLQGRVGATETREAAMDRDLDWIKGAVNALAQHAGVVVPAPPAHP